MRHSGKVWLGAAFATIAGVANVPAQAAPPQYFFEADTVRGVPPGGPTGAPCVLNSQFRTKELIVWRVRVLDAKTGKPVDDKSLKSLVIEMSDGTKVPMRYAGHPNRGPQTDNFWSTSWQVPESYPTGSFGYKVVATNKQGKATSWEPFKVASSQLTIVAAAPPK